MCLRAGALSLLVLHKFGVQALLAESRVDDALTYAEASRGLNQPDLSFEAAYEKILLDGGRSEEAYDKTANVSSAGLTTFRMIARKYPGPRQAADPFPSRRIGRFQTLVCGGRRFSGPGIDKTQFRRSL
jgi:hypothetical protein